ncbi:M10 family metallopeptidase [Siccirubricoccus phaeus]|uniref:M10 family metallopeptidase n=1 Tax=Siccirubricoccus phaeus TaxID=2595053 RepID=UPI00165C2061|nr:M10 family metallopeptidase [Siccirubricoccus phaeus]
MAAFDPLLYLLEDGGTSTRWNFPLAAGTDLALSVGLGTAVSLTYSFMATVPEYESPDIHPGFVPFTAALQDGARRALAAWAAVANLTFTEVADDGGGGQLRFGQESMADRGGYAFPPSFAYTYNPATNTVTGYNAVPWMGDIYINDAPENGVMTSGAYGYEVLVHEIGHALGLQHPQDGADPLPPAEATLRTSVMAYAIPENLGIVTVTGDASAYSWVTGTLYPSGPMLYDIAAMQYLYGANTATNAGATFYGWATNAPLFETIWDGGGIDTIDTSNQVLPSRIDLRDGHFSSIAMRLTEAERHLEIPAWATAVPTPSYDGVDNLAIAFGAVIENARGGVGNDGIVGNDVANWLEGNAGNDTLEGGAGPDTLNGGGGADSLVGGAGDDWFLVDDPGDLVIEEAGGGTDGVTSSVGLYLSAWVENLALAAGTGGISGVGNELANSLIGNEGDNMLVGWGGADVLRGDAGADVLHGAEGDDRLEGEAGLDSLFGGAGNDTLLGGADADVLQGEAGDDSLSGGSDAAFDLLVGGAGNDTLDGASGFGEADQLFGEAGDDLFLVDSAGDLVVEQPGEGSDTVQAAIPGGGYSLPENVEALVLLGSTAFGAGNALGNALTGNAAANYLLGGAGNDTLDGGAGNDLLFGEAGADVFAFRRGTGADVVGDFAAGTDKLLLIGLGFGSLAEVLAGFTVAGGNGALDLGQGDGVVLNGVTSLSAGDVLLA